ncbi:serine acetyltransferase [Paenibacillus sp. MY03]|uniref:serine O-acetyltransferase n=1 Tax=Paenibacillus TaxID=44249 RepID=UPI000B3CF084|nr:MULTISPECIES: serine acetyltransferase [Paenibacillus]OUS69951.1 serine acetyltransferase [Paenibacillus sp. MY03]
MNSIKLYNIARFLYRKKIKILPKLFYYLIFFIYNSIIPYTAILGKGTRLNYGGIGVVIHKHAIIGEYVLIGTNVTIGGNFTSGKRPVIGNNVYVSTGAKILGVNIGNNVIIGANCVVTKDVPDNSVVVGVPGRIIREINEEEATFLNSQNS